jgi:hypothetical protein
MYIVLVYSFLKCTVCAVLMDKNSIFVKKNNVLKYFVLLNVSEGFLKMFTIKRVL